MDVFVTGGTGTIGSAVVRELRDRGHHIVALARSEEASARIRDAGASPFPGDLRDPAGWTDRAMSCDAFIHAGASFSDKMAEIDRKAMQAVLRAATFRKKQLRLIYTGNIWLYPASPQTQLSETTSFDPLPALSWMTGQIRSLQTALNLSVSIIHPSFVCSARSGPIAEMAQALRSGKPFRTRARPDTVWSLISDEDLARLYADVLEGRNFRLSLLATALPAITVQEIASWVEARLGDTLKLKTIAAPEGVDPRHDLDAGLARSQAVNADKATRLLNWAPQLDTIETLVDHLLAETEPAI